MLTKKSPQLACASAGPWRGCARRFSRMARLVCTGRGDPVTRLASTGPSRLVVAASARGEGAPLRERDGGDRSRDIRARHRSCRPGSCRGRFGRRMAGTRPSQSSHEAGRFPLFPRSRPSPAMTPSMSIFFMLGFLRKPERRTWLSLRVVRYDPRVVYVEISIIYWFASLFGSAHHLAQSNLIDEVRLSLELPTVGRFMVLT